MLEMTEHLATQTLTACPQEHLAESNRRLVGCALERLIAELESYGNRVNPAHHEALERILTRLTLLATRQSTGRWAFDLDTGMGKSLSVACWIAAVHACGRGFSVVVGAQQVEGLCKMKRDLVRLGVPEEMVGLRHSKRYQAERAEKARLGQDRDYASEPSCTDAELSTRPYVLVTHERLRNADTAPTYNVYAGRDRDVVVWDEALIASTASVVNADDVESAVGWLGPKARRKGGELEDVWAWLKDALNEAHRSIGRSKQPRPREINLPRLPSALAGGEGESVLLRVIDAHKDAPNDGLQQCAALLGMADAGGKVRVGRVNRGRLPSQARDVVITFRVSVPDELARMVVLDASYPVHALERLDPLLKKDPAFNGRVKRYDSVTLHVWRTPSGKGALDKQFNANNPDSPDMREIVKVLGELPEGSAALLFTHKAYRKGWKRRMVNTPKALQEGMKAAGIDPDAITTDGRSRFPILTWGAAETATNEYAYTSAAIFVSVFFRSHEDVYGMAVGQQRDLVAPVKNVETLMLDLASHHVYQGANRTCARQVIDGQAPEAHFYLRTSYDRIVENLKKLMPGLTVVDWVMAYDHGKAAVGVEKKLAKAVKEYFRNAGPTLDRVTARQLWFDLDVREVAKSVKNRALTAALKELPEWVRMDRSVVRCVPAGVDW